MVHTDLDQQEVHQVLLDAGLALGPQLQEVCKHVLPKLAQATSGIGGHSSREQIECSKQVFHNFGAFFLVNRLEGLCEKQIDLFAWWVVVLGQ